MSGVPGMPLPGWAPELKPCGTPAAYRRHLRRGETLCRSCRQAEQRRQQDRLRERPPPVPSPGRRIREVRHWAGMTQQALAAAVGVPQRKVSRWELGEYDPGPTMLARIAEAAGAPAEWLLPGHAGEASRAAA